MPVTAAVPVAAAGGARPAPAFISPPAAQPAQRSFFGQPETEYVKKPAPAESRSGIRSGYEEAGKKDNTGAVNFLHRMANVGRVLAAKPERLVQQPEQRVSQSSEKAKVEVTERTSKTAADSDYLEIPAFLRRQAN